METQKEREKWEKVISQGLTAVSYTHLKRIDGTMYSCTSLGVKIGGGIGTAGVGWMLEFSGCLLYTSFLTDPAWIKDSVGL